MALKPSRAYKDLSLTFSRNPISGDLNVLKNENAIKRSLQNLFLYRKGEKPFSPDFGSGIPELLFEQFDFVTAGFIREEVLRLVSLYEPRINIVDLVVNLDYDANLYEIQIQYTLPDTSNSVFSTSLTLASSSRV